MGDNSAGQVVRRNVPNDNIQAQENQAAPNANENEPAQRPASMFETVISVFKSLVVRGLIIYFITSFFRKPAPVTDPSGGRNQSQAAFNMFENGTVFDMLVYLSENDHFVDVEDKNSLIWNKSSLIYGDWYSGPNGDGTYDHAVEFTPSTRVQNNGSIYIHTFVVKSSVTKSAPSLKNLSARQETIHVSRRLNKYKKRSFVKTQNLLTGETAASAEDVLKAEKKQTEIVSHWHPNLTINFVTDFTQWVPGSVPSPVNQYIEFLPGQEVYKPVVYYNDFWNLKRDYKPINDTVKKLNLHLTYQPMSMFKWQVYLAQAARANWGSQMYGDSAAEGEEDDQDSLKEMLLETSPYLIGLTAAVSILHSIFELLAFKNDIQFWKNRESLEGLSVRSVFFNVFQSLIVFLYILDNEANMMITISVFIGLLIEIWKIKKVSDISIDRSQKVLGIFPKVIIKDKGSYVESSTKQYDQLAFKYLSWLLFPLLGGYACYSLLYQEHKGWYSWILNMLYGFLLTFGFIMMTPQLFINYKLKSVAHLPWRMMTYKFLNTFIDDIFAFVIKMPTLYRIGCLRDDVVFFIFLYQKWVYKTDPTRVNEFGFSAEMEKQIAESKSQQAIENTSTSDSGTESSNKGASEKKRD